MARNKQLDQAVGRLANRVRNHCDTDADRLALAEAQLMKYVAEVVSKAPPLTPEIIDAVVAILRPVGDDEL